MVAVTYLCAVGWSTTTPRASPNEVIRMPEPENTIERVRNSHLPGQSLGLRELFDAARVLDSAADKSAPGFGAARKRVEAQLEELGY